MRTKAALIRSGLATLTCELFDNRHIKHTDRMTGENLYRTASIEAVIAAHSNLNLLDARWSSHDQAPATVRAVQVELDRILKK